MIEEKLKMAAEKLPVPQTTFKNILERAAQKESALRERISERIMRCLIAVKNE
mgnify:CR=1 FL=1